MQETSMKGESRAEERSVSSTVEKFEAIKIVHRTPLDPPPVIVKASKKIKSPPPPELKSADQDDGSDLGPPPPVPPTPPPADDEIHFRPQQASSTPPPSLPPEPPKSAKKPKKTKSLENSKETTVKKEPDLNLIPRKSSLKKPRSKSYIEVKLPGLWFNMDDQYPVQNFSGREKILEAIHSVVHGQKSRDARPISRAIALVGKSGMGKTEIVRKFAFKFYVDSNGGGNVVWFDGSSRQSIIQTLLRLYEKELKNFDYYEQYASTPEISSDADGTQATSQAKEVKRAGKSNRKKTTKNPEEEDLIDEKIQRILRHRIFQENHTLFIFDNTNSEEDIIDFLPNLSPVGHIPSILVTSLHPHNWNNARVFQVNEFEFKEAVDFLCANLGHVPGFTRFQAEDLAKELHRFPRLLQRTKRMIDSQLETSDWALAKLEKNNSLVRRLKSEGVVRSRAIEIAGLSVDRGNFHSEDPYLLEYDGEPRTHPVSMVFHRAEALMAGFEDADRDLSVLAISEDSYIIALLAFTHPRIKITAAYGSEYSKEDIEKITGQLNMEGVIASGRVEIRPVETSTKNKQAKITPVIDKLRSQDSKTLYDLILVPSLDEVDLKPVKRLLKSSGRFITSMSSGTVGQLLKKVDPKKMEVRIMKHDFPELLVIANKISNTSQ